MNDQSWMIHAARAVKRRLEARGMKVWPIGESEGPTMPFYLYEISMNGFQFAEMEVRSSGRSDRTVRVSVLRGIVPKYSSGGVKLHGGAPVIECGRYSKRSPNVRRFGAVLAKRLTLYGVAACMEEVRKIHDS
jgi:hypothetical protein